VDLYNAVSLAHGIPMGGHDLDTISGGVRVGLTEGGEPFRAMFSEDVERVSAGEVAYLDDQEVLTRHWVWRQCHKDRITPGIRSVLVPIDGLPEVGIELVRAAAEEMAGHLRAFFGADVLVGFSTAESPIVEMGPA
jgi:DNA/RNA-binding domain of Phe-tRNA-synthetase-like protein